MLFSLIRKNLTQRILGVLQNSPIADWSLTLQWFGSLNLKQEGLKALNRSPE